MWDFVMDKSGAGAGFHRELGFPLPIYIPSASPQSSSLSPEAGTIGQAGVAVVPIASQTRIKKKKSYRPLKVPSIFMVEEQANQEISMKRASKLLTLQP
jgi:hypothetical protein